MQYLLTQEEYDKLTKREKPLISVTRSQLQTLCTEIANTMPVVWGWGGPDPKPWGCIIGEDDWHCDKCPVQTICPNENKDYSK